MVLSAVTLGGALAGGVLIGLGAALLWFSLGRTAGVSGIVGGLVRPVAGDTAWRAFFVLGLVLAGVVGYFLRPDAIGASPRSWALLALAGALVGVGTRVGGGCTSGHGVCGIGRGSRRSFAATLAFMATGVATAALMHVVGGGR